jgi:peptidoglycan/LPS O-acetylase OafA/YrhL
MPRGLSIYLDILRVLAALQVALYHLGWLERIGIGQHVWNRWGHEAVVIFFVLSGFVIRYSVDVKDHTFRDYATSRLSRLYSVVLPCIALTLLFDAVGARLVPELYRNAGLDDTAALALTRVVFSVLMLNESWLSVGLGTNAPYWSVCYEFWYYALFAASIYAAGWQRIGLLLMLSMAAGPHIMLLFPIWLLGAWVYSSPMGQTWSRPVVWLGFLQIIGVMACHVYFDLPNLCAEWLSSVISRNISWSAFALSDTLLGLSFTLHVLAARQLDQLLWRALAGIAGIARAAAARSFTLYLIHMPLMMVLTSMCLAAGLGTSPWLVGFGTVALPLLIAPAIENQRHRLRTWLLQMSSPPTLPSTLATPR